MENKIIEIEEVKEDIVKRGKGRPRKVEGKHSKDKDVAHTYQLEYYAKNKKKLLEDMTTKVKCEHCFNTVSKCNLNAHHKSKKCVAIQKLNDAGL